MFMDLLEASGKRAERLGQAVLAAPFSQLFYFKRHPVNAFLRCR
jgi:hypothetical protein